MKEIFTLFCQLLKKILSKLCAFPKSTISMGGGGVFYGGIFADNPFSGVSVRLFT